MVQRKCWLIPPQNPQLLLPWIFTVAARPVYLHRRECNKPRSELNSKCCLLLLAIIQKEESQAPVRVVRTPQLCFLSEYFPACFFWAGPPRPLSSCPIYPQGENKSCLFIPSHVNIGSETVWKDCNRQLQKTVSVLNPESSFSQHQLHPYILTTQEHLFLTQCHSSLKYNSSENSSLPLCPRKLLSFLCS